MLIRNYLDILVIEETKLDPSFPDDQFFIEGYSKPYRLDRNRNGGGVIIYVREDIPSKLLNKHFFTNNIEENREIIQEASLKRKKGIIFRI